MSRPPKAHRVAYLAAEYPAVSHTFILREVEALRRLGLDVRTCSVRTTAAEHHEGAAEKQAGQDTFYILKAARDPRTLLAAQGAALRAPGRYFAALWQALSMRAPGLRALLYQIIYFVEATVLAAHLRRIGATHLHNHFANASATVAMLAARIAGIPFSYTLHGPSDLMDPARWRLDLKTEAAQFVACISYFARSQAMLASDPVHWDKLRVIHCGVEPARYAPAPSTDTHTDLVFVGRLAAVKGVRILLGALRAALPEHPNLRLTLVGDGPDRAALAVEAQDLGEAVQFLGYQTQEAVAEILARADMMVLPSFAEGVPVVLMEAMASQVPVIATQVAGVSELVEHDKSGLIVPPGDQAALTRAILSLAQDPARRARMGKAGRRRVGAAFDIDGEAQRLAALFEGRAAPGPRPDTTDNP